MSTTPFELPPQDGERFCTAVRELRALARLKARRLKAQGILEPAITRVGVGGLDLVYQYLSIGCHVGDLVICRSRGLIDRLTVLCGFVPVVIAFEELKDAHLPNRIVAGAPRAALVLGLAKELAEGRGCSPALIEEIDADEFVYLD